ncbi:MAG TPA: FIST N-terminal domain-containing protein [Opitutus sp.]|nr:FIST N-terminal domain-containing protein [Opitutus sp.]
MHAQRLRAGTGQSIQQDSRAAGIEAARAAVARLEGEPPALVFVFTSPRFNLPELLAGVRSVTGAAALVGATGSGEIVEGRYLGFGEGVGVLALSAGPYRFGVASAARVREELEAAGGNLARAARAAAGPSAHAAVVLLVDSMAGDLQQFVQGVYGVTGPTVAMVGAGAGDEQKFERTLVFHDGEIREEGAVVIWIASEHPLHVVTRHGWQPIGIPMLVTRVAGTEIVELGGRAAADVYEEQLGVAPGALPAEKFWRTSILHPFGLIQPDGTTVIRVARAKTPGHALRIQGCVPPTGSAVQVMNGSADSLLAIAPDVVRESLAANPAAGAVLTFSCAARAMIFGPRVPEEAECMQETAGSVPTFGFYCCAEFARTSGVLGTHNATLTALAL